MSTLVTTAVPLTGPIHAEAYMDVLMQRQTAWLAEHGGPLRYPPLLEWFIQPGDEQYVILPEATPAPERPRKPRVYRSADSLRAELATVETLMVAAAGRDTTADRAAANLSPHSRSKAAARAGRRRFAQMDRDLRRYAELAKRRDGLTSQLARAESRETRHG